MRVLLSGISSFTGFWFARTLANRGHNVVGTLTRRLDSYDGLRKSRLDSLGEGCTVVESAPFGSPEFVRLVRDGGFDAVCAHGALVEGYRDKNFPFIKAAEGNTRNIAEVCEMIASGGRDSRLVLTGSVFEANEGVGDPDRRAFSAYGLSKTLTSQVFEFFAGEFGVPLVKFVVPNPFGPLEEPRFIHYLMNTWRAGETASVRTPEYIRDNIHVDLLASCYVSALEAEVWSSALKVIRPSGYVESQGAFSLRVSREMSRRTGWECGVDLARQTDFSEPMFRTNDQPASVQVENWDEE